MTTRPHGYARYRLDGCRCYTCGFAVSQYNDNRARAIAYGTWHPFVSAEPARQHVTALRACGMGLRTIAQVSGVDRSVLQALMKGRPERGTPPPEKIRPATASALLAVEPALDLLSGKTVIDATGTRRRVQALVTLGWSQAKIANRLGWTEGKLSALLRREQTIVSTARAVRALYDELWDQAPPEDTHREKIAASRARNHALANGWAPPMAWDDDRIDDPAAQPNLGEDTPRMEALAENAYELITRHGCTPEAAAQRLGVTVDYVTKLHRLASRRAEAA